MTEYEACKHILETKLEAIKWKRDQLKDERRDMRDDPEVGPGSKEYEQVRMELRAERIRYWLLYDILETLDSDVLDVLQGVWW